MATRKKLTHIEKIPERYDNGVGTHAYCGLKLTESIESVTPRRATQIRAERRRGINNGEKFCRTCVRICEP